MEILDVDSNVKMMANVLVMLKINNDNYMFYAINRDDEQDNVFVSKLVKNSEGYTTSYEFVNGEKESLDSIFSMLINNDDLKDNKNIEIVKDLELAMYNKFSSNICYVASCSKNIINNVISKYGESSSSRVIVKKPEENDSINYNNLFLVLFGILVLIVCFWIVYISLIK